MQGTSEQLSTWVAGQSWGDVPQSVRDVARFHILDVVGVMLAARQSDIVAASARGMARTDAGSEAKALGFKNTLSLGGAAFVNGVMASVLEFDDTHIESFVHSTVAPFAVALAFCHSTHLSGPQLMQAVILGSELGCRLGLVSPLRLHSVGIHPTAIMGTFGATYALAKLQNLNQAQMTGAIGHSASMCGGLMASWQDGSSTKTLHVGMAAAQAVRAVALAREGITGPSSVFDGRFGWFRTHLQAVAPADFRFSRATESLGHEWEMLNVASKPYPSAFTIHPYVDAVLALKSALDIDVSRIAEIRCEIAQSSVATLCEPVAEKLRPLTPWHGRISLQHSLAEAFIIGKMDKNSYGWDALKDPRIQALADKVTYCVDPVRHLNAKKSGAHVTIFLNDGSNMCHVIDSVRGTRDNPISEEDYFRKFRSNADGVLSPSLVEKTIDSMMTLEGHDDIAPIFDRLSAPDDIRT